MKNKREEILSRLEAIKQEKKQLKKQLNDLHSLEVGKWYKDKHSKALYFIEYIDFTKTNGVKSYGFTMIGEWTESMSRSYKIISNDFKPATDKEVETALIAEAKKRGFEGDDFEYSAKYNELGLVWERIFENGKWAEIIKPKTVHIPEGDYTETQLKDILNNLYEK